MNHCQQYSKSQLIQPYARPLQDFSMAKLFVEIKPAVASASVITLFDHASLGESVRTEDSLTSLKRGSKYQLHMSA